MPSGRVLIIAPSIDLRKSLVFALEAEGYVVTSLAVLPSEDVAGSYDCVVIDHKAATGSREAVLDFIVKARRVVLLAGTPQPWLISHVTAVVPTPLRGDALGQAVRLAVN